MIEKLLVANRGEIASRVFRTCRDQGIGTVAIHSDADADAAYVAAADLAVRLPGLTPADTYLRGEAIVAATVAAGADAVHPGYGFLSENADFARAVLAAGLTWVGPAPETIALMSSKIESKRLVAAAGVPVLGELEPDAVQDDDFPLLVKASAGGGGRGMRVVEQRAALESAVESARAEAAAAFGEATVFCERYVAGGRHVEVQVLADAEGTVWALGERDCSIQRRYQKVVEETPAPALPERLRERLWEAARTVASAVGYLGAGTVEFLVGRDGEFFFLEMNTRLQVEHPVTECVTGLDLVAWQLRIAEGEPLVGDPPQPRGHAIEARLYAEDPAEDWRPQSGPLHRLSVRPCATEFAVPDRYGIRLDSAVADGAEVSVHYDPLLAKVIAWGPGRAAAARMLAGALASARIHGVTTNRDSLVAVLRHPEFLSGHIDTEFLTRHPAVTAAAPDDDTVRLSAVAAALADAEHRRAQARVLATLPIGWRNVAAQPQLTTYLHGTTEHHVRYTTGRAGPVPAELPGVDVAETSAHRVVLERGGIRYPFAVTRYSGLVEVDSALGAVRLAPVPRFREPATELAVGSLVAPMPGTVVRVAVSVGQRVVAGQALLWLEAMKMEHRVAAPADGVVTELPLAPDAQVEQGTVLAVVTPDGHEPADPLGTAEAGKESV